jgi:DNA-directed RNA polymerase subunit RPC12/RpoP
VDLAIELQKIYDSEINIRIAWMWDGGIEIRLGDEMNGFLAEEVVPSAGEILPWLQEAIAHFFAESTYAASLSAEVRDRGARQMFLPPQMRQSIKCPRCGEMNSTMMDETFAFVCQHCGGSVTLKPPNVQ